MYTDTHFHYPETIRRGTSPGTLLQQFAPDNISLAIEVAIRGHHDFEQRYQALLNHPGIYFATGYHPSQTGQVAPADVANRLQPSIDNDRVIAIGETGLDYYRDFGPTDQQQELFQAQLELANQTQLPVIIHNRAAGQDTLAILRRTPPQAGGIIHCFDEKLELARQFLDLGLHISFSGNITFKRNEQLRKTLKTIPSERLLLETDSPYLTPEPHRGQPNSPALIAHTYQVAAEQRGITVRELASIVRRNTLSLFPGIDIRYAAEPTA